MKTKPNIKQIAEILSGLEKKHGKLTADIVLEEAGNKTSVLHSQFNWDDAAAAHQHRLWQAHQLIAKVRVIYIRGDETQNSVRAYVCLNHGKGYISTAKVMSDEAMREQFIEQGKAELERWRQRYESFVEFANVVAAIDSTVKRQNSNAQPSSGQRSRATQRNAVKAA